MIKKPYLIFLFLVPAVIFLYMFFQEEKQEALMFSQPMDLFVFLQDKHDLDLPILVVSETKSPQAEASGWSIGSWSHASVKHSVVHNTLIKGANGKLVSVTFREDKNGFTFLTSWDMK